MSFRSLTQCLYFNKNCSLPAVQDETKFSSKSSVTTLKSKKSFLPNLHSLSGDLLNTLWVVTLRVVCSWHTARDTLQGAVTNLCFPITEWGAATLLQYVWLFSKKLRWKLIQSRCPKLAKSWFSTLTKEEPKYNQEDRCRNSPPYTVLHAGQI